MNAKKNVIIVFSFFMFLYLILTVNLFYLQVIKHDFFRKVALDQRLETVTLAPDRGDIFDRNGSLLATSVDSYSIGARPLAIKDQKMTAAKLAKALKTDARSLYEKLAQGKKFIWIERKADSNIKEAVKNLKLKGIDIYTEKKRIYPNGRLSSQILGFVGIDNQGLAGIEQEYDTYLRGMEGKLIGEKDVQGRDIMTSKLREIQSPSNGMDVTLTIDEPIQYFAEKQIRKAVKELGAKSGMAIVINVKTGELLALAGYPDFDPNEYSKFDPELWRNSAVTGVYEPGSTFKLVTIASAIQDGTITTNSKIYCPDIINIGKRTIKNSHKINFDTRYVSPAKVLEQSINTGAAQVAMKMGRGRFYESIRKFGFGERTGIDLPGESRGILRDEAEWNDIDVGTISFGQGIAVTPIQLLTGISAIANDGKLIRPQVVRKIESANKSYIKIFAPERIGRPLSEKTAHDVLKMSEDVVTMGTGKPAAIKNFRVGGKTGTAQKAKSGGYYEGSFVSSFIGFVPLADPDISVLVIIDDPQKEYWGETTAAPVFRDVAEFALRRLNIAPDNVNAKPVKGMI